MHPTVIRFFCLIFVLPFLQACSQKPSNGYARLGDTSLYYERSGSGEPLILIHPFALDQRVWNEVVSDLSKEHEVIRYDIRGFGKSILGKDIPHNPSHDLLRLMDVLGVEKAHLMGLGLGANIAVRMAIDHPDRVHKLVLLSPNLDGFQDYSETYMDLYARAMSLAANEQLSQGIQTIRLGPLMQLTRPDSAKESLLDSMVYEYSGLHLQAIGFITRSEPPAMTRLGEIKAPSLIMVGNEDLPDMFRIAEVLDKGIPDSKKVILPQAGHLLLWDTKETFLSQVMVHFQ